MRIAERVLSNSLRNGLLKFCYKNRYFEQLLLESRTHGRRSSTTLLDDRNNSPLSIEEKQSSDILEDVRPWPYLVHHIILNKPPGVIVAVQTQKPERGRATPTKRPSVKDLLTLENAFRRDHNERIPHPKYLMGLKIVRGLNVHDSGMIVFTQCKHAWSKIVKSHNVEKEYIVRLKYSKTRDTSLLDPSMTAIIDLKLEKLREGVTSRSRELLEVVKVEIVNDDEIRMILKEERAHHVRRMLETVRWEVETMKRVRIAEIALEDLPEGKWRYLAPHEHFFKTDPRLPQ